MRVDWIGLLIALGIAGGVALKLMSAAEQSSKFQGGSGLGVYGLWIFIGALFLLMLPIWRDLISVLRRTHFLRQQPTDKRMMTLPRDRKDDEQQ